jgi:hypothetical protein
VLVHVGGRTVTPIEAARTYLRLGFAPVPIPLRSKAARLPGWPDLVVTDDQVEGLFRDGNIGLLLGARSGGLVDVDLDAPAAVELAPDFLPATGRIHGRASKPRSHWWYRVARPPTTKQFKGCRGESLVELRGTGGQTLVPPSVHPSGESIEWAAEGAFTEILAEALLLAVQKLAAATLMVSYYPAEGSRQDFAMALSGLLLQGGWPESETVHFVECVARVARDEEIASRIDASQRTALWPAAGFTDTWLRWMMMPEVADVDEKGIYPRVQG